MQFNVSVEVKMKDLAGLLCSGFEGGTNYWLKVMDYYMDYRKPPICEPIFEEKHKTENIEYYEYPFLTGGAVICRLLEEETDEKYQPLILNLQSIDKGVKLMIKDHPWHWADFIAGKYDATTGDIFIQLCLLGDIVYG